MSIPHLNAIALPALAMAGTFVILHLAWRRRTRGLERELLACTEAICQMADTHIATHRKLTDAIAALEERIVELSVPGPDPGVALDKRHRVLRLARNGVALDDISRRLKLPRGEAELILSLRKYVETGPTHNPAVNGDSQSHGQS